MPFSPGTLHLREVHTQLLSLLLGGLRGVRLLLASAALVLAFALLASFFLLFISATAAGEPAGQTAHGVLGLLGRSSGDLRRLSRYLSCLVGHLPDLIRDSIQRSSAVLAFGLVVHSYSFLSTALQGSRLLIRGADHVPDGNTPFSPGTLHLREVHTQLLSLLLGGLRSVRLLLLLASSGRLLSLLGCLPRCLLPLLGCLPGGVLGLLGGSSGGLLRLSRNLSCLIGSLPGYLLGLPGRLSGRVLGLARNLPDLIGDPAQGTPASLAFATLLAAAGEPANGVLHLLGCLACGVLGLLGGSSGGLLRLSRNLPCLVGGLPGYLLGLACCLSGGILRLLGRFLRELLHLLHGLLGSLVHRFLDTRILGRLIHGALELHVGVDHLLDLGLLVAFGELLSVLLQLFAVTLSLALDPTQRLPVEVLGVLHGLLLHLLL